ncbi:hypothetical protein AB0D47_39765 [Streptomyces sp. NPDC048376]|uniref:hypothetical protein n=1 Tax=unclassified Streptomyces TaxID=2593676 RepID=UPI003436976C
MLNIHTAIGVSVFAISPRLLALRYGWRTPRSYFWRDPFSGIGTSRSWHGTGPAGAVLAAGGRHRGP